MKTYSYKIRLCKDAEPGTGLGGEIVNDLVPRDVDGLPVLPASHIKGLMRAALREIVKPRSSDWSSFLNLAVGQSCSDGLIDRVFGQEDERRPDAEGRLRFADAEIALAKRKKKSEKTLTHTVSRTSLSENGIAKDTSLRTTEAVHKGTIFSGKIHCEFDESTVEGIAWRLALMSITAVGGSRSRTGQAVAEWIEAPQAEQSPGKLLLELDKAIRAKQFTNPGELKTGRFSKAPDASNATAIVELLFVADSAICCPETPDKTNVVSSGFSIPGSTIQGIILHRINRQNPELATELFHADNFRCWPLNPCANPQDERILDVLDGHPSGWFDELPNSIRVSLSHRAAKFSTKEKEYSTKYFFDPACRIEPYEWPKNPDNAPLKASDGVILFGDGTQRLHRRDGNIPKRLLWKASHMPRKLSTHGVLDGPKCRENTRTDGRNLFSVEAIAPLIWRGQVAVPESIADLLVDDFDAHPHVSVGKARTVRGQGRMIARRVDTADAAILNGSDFGTVLVLQSPVQIPSEMHGELSRHESSSEDILRKMAEDWREHYELPELAKAPNVWANAGIRFGWNRTIGFGGRAAGFQNAVPVLMPGSVFTLASQADPMKLRRALLAGFCADPQNGPDPGRLRSFGSLAVHPGTAESLYISEPTKRVMSAQPFRKAMELVLNLEAKSHLPSPSQIRAVEQRILAGTPVEQKSLEDARSYLERQCKRIVRIWHDWESAYGEVTEILTQCSPADAKKALKALADIAVAKQKENR